MTEERIYTPEELAKKLQISKYTVYEMIKRGDLAAHHIGRQIRITESQFRQFLEEGPAPEANTFTGDVFEQEGEVLARVDGTDLRVSTPVRGRARLQIRPEDIILSKSPFVSSARNNVEGTILEIVKEGSRCLILLDVGIGIQALITLRSLEEMGLKVGESCYGIFKATAVQVSAL